jgi:hypothetical protein
MDPHFLDLGTSWECSTSRPGRFTPGEISPGNHWIEHGAQKIIWIKQTGNTIEKTV